MTLVLFLVLTASQPRILAEHGPIHASSCGRFWVASAIKVLPALALARWARQHKISLSCEVKQQNKTWGSLRSILTRSLVESSNLDYDRSVDIVGLQEVNALARRLGLSQTALLYAYGSKRTLRRSPALSIVCKHRALFLPKKIDRSSIKCHGSSVWDLSALLGMAVQDPDLKVILAKTPSFMRRTVYARFHGYFPIYAKAGYVRGRSLVLNATFLHYRITLVIPAQTHFVQDVRQAQVLVARILRKIRTKEPTR